MPFNPIEHNNMEQTRGKKHPPKAKVDLSYLEDLADGDDGFIIEVITLFLKDTPDSLKQMVLYNKTNNYPLLKTSVHKLKSSLRMLGNDILADLAQDIETQLANQTYESLTTTLLMGFIARVNHFLDNLHTELAARVAKANAAK